MRIPVVLAAAALMFGGCSDEPAPERASREAKPRPERPPATPRVEPVRCPAGAPPICRAASGRVIYVEAVDADGDGDAHFVLASRQGISAPGITAIDVRKGLRPHPLPRIGDAVAAAGPVYRGSFGQRQIHALDLRVARASRRAP